jgi:hypothetical protein
MSGTSLLTLFVSPERPLLRTYIRSARGQRRGACAVELGPGLGLGLVITAVPSF